MIFTPYQQRTLQRRTAAELRQKFLHETESFLAKELNLRGISSRTNRRAQSYRHHRGRQQFAAR